jgi:hypothetical protein
VRPAAAERPARPERAAGTVAPPADVEGSALPVAEAADAAAAEGDSTQVTPTVSSGDEPEQPRDATPPGEEGRE